MEKRSPSYDLAEIKRTMGDPDTLSMTTSARRDAAEIGFDDDGIAGVIQSIERRMFYKSMTTHGSHRVWQDVYHVPARDMVLYVKFQAGLVAAFTIMSFKEK